MSKVVLMEAPFRLGRCCKKSFSTALLGAAEFLVSLLHPTISKELPQ